jgi:hypothetical protein
MADKRHQDDLDRIFAHARAQQPGPELAARVLADAAAVQTARAAPPAPTPRRGGWFAGALGAIGGWPGLSGVTAAGVLGLSIGLYAPDLVDTVSGGQIWSLTGGLSVTPDIGSLGVEVGDV